MIKGKKMRAKVSFMLLVCIALSMNSILCSALENPMQSQTQPSAVTVPDDFSTLQEALKNAEHGATVYLKEGVYSITSPITIAQNISIIGIGKPIVEFSGEGKILIKTEESVEIKKDAPNVTLEGIKFIGKYGESEFKELEYLEAICGKGVRQEIDNVKEYHVFMYELDSLFDSANDTSKVMTEKYSLITILAGSSSMKSCTFSCDSGGGLLVIGEKSFLTVTDTLFEKNGFDAIVVTESEVSFDSCTFANNRNCPLVLKQDAKGVLTNCTINDSLIGLQACKDSNLIVEKTLVSGCDVAIVCSSSSSLHLLEVKLTNSKLRHILLLDYSKARVVRTFFSDAPVHIFSVNHTEMEIVGYRNALDEIHTFYNQMVISEQTILHLHQVMTECCTDGLDRKSL